MSSVNLWDEVLAKVEGKVNRHSFATWFRPTNYLALHGTSLLIGVPNAQFKDWLTKNYQGVLTEALVDLGHKEVQVDERLREDALVVLREPILELRVRDPDEQFKDWLTKNYQGVLTEALVDLGHKEVQVVFEEAADAAAPAAPATPEREVSSLNPKYTFDSFVVDERLRED